MYYYHTLHDVPFVILMHVSLGTPQDDCIAPPVFSLFVFSGMSPDGEVSGVSSMLKAALTSPLPVGPALSSV